MTTTAKTLVALGLMGAVLAPQTAGGESILKTRAPDASDFQKFLPSLPADVPWLTTERRTPVEGSALPEAGSVSAWMLVPQPAEGWAPLTSQPAALRSPQKNVGP